MAVPNNPSLSDIQTEFGGSPPISISEYYAGGPLVPSGSPAVRARQEPYPSATFLHNLIHPEPLVQIRLAIWCLSA